MRSPRLVVPALVCTLGFLLAGCSQQPGAMLNRDARMDPSALAQRQASAQASSTEPTVGQLWGSFQASLAAARSMRITGVVQLSGKAATVDMSGMCDGSNGRSTVAIDNQSLEVTAVSGTYYLKANTAYWRAAGMKQDVIVAIGSRYLASKDPKLGEFTVAGFIGSLKSEQAITEGMGVIAEKTTLTGRPVYLFSVRTQDGRVTIWVTDKGYALLKMRYETSAGTDEITFSEWDMPVSYKAPPPAQIITL
ncbi:MAG TPA: hypothetical protein VFK68_04195 [Propionibacteriaceae bacterium]|nr:hypothetical protein [Propionibacteriaceae bacterium]